MNLHQRELQLRKQTFDWLRSTYSALPEIEATYQEDIRQRREQGLEPLALLDRLRQNNDPEEFRRGLDIVTKRRDSRLGLSGPNGQMVLNQIVNNSQDPVRASQELVAALTPPRDDLDAAAKIERLAAYCLEIRKGTAPQSGRVPPLASMFWSFADSARWPPKWSSASTAFERLGWSLPSGLGAGYVEFADVMRLFDDPEQALGVLAWFSSTPWLGPDPTLESRVKWAQELKQSGEDSEPYAFVNVDAILGPLRQAGDDMNTLVGQSLQHDVSKRISARDHKLADSSPARCDAYVAWLVKGVDSGWTVAPNLRFWVGPEGVMVGLHPGYRSQGWVKLAKQHIQVPAGYEKLQYLAVSQKAGQSPSPADFVVGKFLSFENLDWAQLPGLIQQAATDMSETLRDLLANGVNWGKGSSGTTTDTTRGRGDAGNSDLAQFYLKWIAETGYPRDGDLMEGVEREKMAEMLSKASLPNISIANFRWIMNTKRWGFAGFRAVLNATIADPDEDMVQQQISDVVGELLYGQGSVAERLDRCPPKLKGLGQAGASKLLSIVYPEVFLPIHPLTDSHGKLAILPVIGIEEIPVGTLGERSVRANDLIRERLSMIPALRDDLWGQMEFAYWLSNQEAAVEDDLDGRLEAATDRCTLPPGSPFLYELIELLEDKGQIVLYGPPGTGKTYLALELAEALAPDEDCRSLVQFHPSVAYEDFMEGFRPVLRDGQLTYELRHGPLIELAGRAALDSRIHVLIIDEMNRANLPKVFGELLFLLEYRDRPARLAYRSAGDTFALPENLWIIGTMNLADRSVGQIDAALRRRFAFVPFSPSDENNGGLLRRWLTKQNHPTWPADLVDEVNTELETDLGHSDLLIGPSYFMKEQVDEEQMSRIWRYSIEPLASDLFHGDELLVSKYQWDSVIQRHGSLLPQSRVADVRD